MNSLLARVCALALVVLAIALHANAQPIRQDDKNHWIVTIPTGVEVFDDGRAEPLNDPFIMTVTTQDIVVTALADVPGVLPASVPLYTTDVNGVRGLGIPARINAGMQIYLNPQGPEAVFINSLGQYQAYVETSLAGGHFENLPLRDGPTTVDVISIAINCANRPLPYSTIRVVYGSFPPVPFVPRANWTPTYQTDTTLPANPTGQLILDAMDRTAARLGLIMPANLGPTRIKQIFTPNNGNAAIGPLTQNVIVTRDLQDVLTHLRNAYAANSELGSEGTLYDLFPANATIPVKFRQSTVPVAVSSVVVPKSTLPQLLYAQTGGSFEAQTTWNTDAFTAGRFNLAPKKGRIAGKIDFDGALFHETCHALGFDTNMDNGTQIMNKVFLWDLFRLDSALGPSVSQTTWTDATIPRMLFPGTEAIYVTGLFSSTLAYRASTGQYSTGPTGDGHGAAHWKHVGLLIAQNPTAQRIGIMDPIAEDAVNANPNLPRIRGYFTVPDLQALTTIGWNLDVSSVIPGPGDFPVNPPAGFPTLTTTTPTFTWANSDGADKYHVTVYRVVDNIIREIHHVENLTATTYTLPAAILAGGRQYQFYVTSENDMGYGFSPALVFSSPGACAGDFNGQGGLSAQDIFDFLSAWFASTPNADFNGDGIITVQDIFDFLNAWFAGC